MPEPKLCLSTRFNRTRFTTTHIPPSRGARSGRRQAKSRRVTTEKFVRISTGSIWDDDRDSVGASRSFRQITRGSKVSVFLTRQVDEYAREM
jgi:hypothetical protein